MGVLYILVSGACFGLLPWFARVAYAHGADPFGMLAARFTIAFSILLVVRSARMRRRPWPDRAVLARLLLLGAVGYAPQATFFFNGVKRIDTSLATVIFYTYPVLVVLASWLVFRHRPTRTTSLCLAVAVIGAALTAGQVGAGSAAGVILMFAAACWYTGYIIASSRIVRNVDSLTSITVVMLGAAVAHVLILAFSDSHLPTDGKGWLAALGAAVFSTVIAMGFFFAGVKIVGPANLPAELPTDSSALFSRNLLNFITPMVDKETKALKIDTNDEVVKGTLVTQNGQIVHPSLTQS